MKTLQDQLDSIKAIHAAKCGKEILRKRKLTLRTQIGVLALIYL